jgi:hypothetical protein
MYLTCCNKPNTSSFKGIGGQCPYEYILDKRSYKESQTSESRHTQKETKKIKENKMKIIANECFATIRQSQGSILSWLSAKAD